ncbi:hypothetical protein FACS189487_05160 [Campylobacterota bacterium]|nr:hypothetical protein FACS189487_05160 [Campylobacterota bacterium]
MNQKFIQLIKAVSDHDRGALFNAPKLAALLSDRAKNEFKQEYKLLQIAVGSGAGSAIYNAENMEICKKIQIENLRTNYFMDTADAIEIVDFLAFVLRGDLNKIVTKEPISITDPIPDPISYFTPPPLMSENVSIFITIVRALKLVIFGAIFGAIPGLVFGGYLAPVLAFVGAFIGILIGAFGGVILKVFNRNKNASSRLIILSIRYSIISTVIFIVSSLIFYEFVMLSGMIVGVFLAFVNVATGEKRSSILAWMFLGAMAGMFSILIPLSESLYLPTNNLANLVLCAIVAGALTGAVLGILDEKSWERKHRSPSEY